mgnify:FL=1
MTRKGRQRKGETMGILEKPIVVAGLVCVDITPQFAADGGYSLQSCLQPGKIVRTHGVTISAGGVVANTGLALRKLGAKVHLMYMVSDDPFGKMVTEQLEAACVPATRRVTYESATSYSVILALPGSDRIILHDVGANDILDDTDFDYDVIQNACIFHFGYPQSMRQFYLNKAEKLVRMYERVHSMGVATSLDMAMADAASECGRVDWGSVVKRVLPYVDLFEPSLEEICWAVDPERYAAWNAQAVAEGKSILQIVPQDYVPELAERLLQWGGRVVLIKCGEKGMYLRTASQARLDDIGGGLAENLRGWGDQAIWMPCFHVDTVRSGTGAGDTSIAGFLYAIQRGFPVRRCVELAAATGACCVTAYDALSAIEPLDAINAKIEAGWKHSE